tara:strand:+ start:238 stop:615 length:378 start_codon:yes stop_codon:yes gene_type:complete
MAKLNPYMKYLGPEDHLQRAVLNYLTMQYPNSLVAHPANEGKRSPFERFKLKYLGVSSGIPDILIFTPSKQFTGLAIELKVGYNKPSENQKKWLDNLKNCNWYSICLNDFDKCKLLIDQYFNNGL